MQLKRRAFVTVSLGVLLMGAAGCGGGDSLPREAVSGTITFAGAPLATGLIQFFPSKSEGAGTTAGGVITDGKYTIPKAQGLVPGTYKVLISSAPAGPEADDTVLPGPEASKPPPKDMIPAKYNTSSTLSAEIKAGDKNVFDFDLKR